MKMSEGIADADAIERERAGAVGRRWFLPQVGLSVRNQDGKGIGRRGGGQPLRHVLEQSGVVSGLLGIGRMDGSLQFRGYLLPDIFAER